MNRKERADDMRKWADEYEQGGKIAWAYWHIVFPTYILGKFLFYLLAIFGIIYLFTL